MTNLNYSISLVFTRLGSHPLSGSSLLYYWGPFDYSCSSVFNRYASAMAYSLNSYFAYFVCLEPCTCHSFFRRFHQYWIVSCDVEGSSVANNGLQLLSCLIGWFGCGRLIDFYFIYRYHVHIIGPFSSHQPSFECILRCQKVETFVKLPDRLVAGGWCR